MNFQARGPSATGAFDPAADHSRSTGAANLIEGCIGDVAGKLVLLVCEDPKHGWYDAAAPEHVHRELVLRGATVRKMIVDLPENHPNAAVQAAMNVADEVVFFSRLGDQGRFNWHYVGPHCVMSYALNEGMLNSGFGSLDHLAMCRLKSAIDEVTLSADNIRVTCPLGTAFDGQPGTAITSGSEVVISRFPMGIPQPVPASGFSGKVVLANYLTPTGSKVYEPGYLELRKPVTAHFEGNRITGFSGAADVVAAIEAHYANVGERFGLDSYNIDSWHAGIHPMMSYDSAAETDPLRWAGNAFQHQRLLHFHTCGSGPPGEICWNVVDPTIYVDGVALWENGKLHPERFEVTGRVLDDNPALAAAFRNACGPLGLS